MGRFATGMVLGLVMLPLLVLAWFQWGNPPVAVADTPFPFERLVVGVPLNARIHREMVATPPIMPDESNLVAGADLSG